MQRPFRQQYQVLDRMAVQYMDSYRGSFILNFLLGAVAVFFAVQSYFTVPPGQHGHQFWSVLELICLFAILGTYLANRLGDWKKKAVDLRFLAEYLRHIEVLILLGRSTRLLQLAPHHHAHRQPANTWMGWYLNAFLRAQGPFPGLQSQDTARTVTMDAGYAKRVQQYMCGDWLEYQYGYHTQQARRYARWETRSAGLMTVLFAVIVLCVVAHLVGWQWWYPSGWHPDALIALAVIVLPALLAAIHGITVQGEFERLAERSAATADYLEKMIPSFNAINPDKHYDFADAVGDHAVEAAQAMIEEVTDWQILYRAHGVELT